MILNFPLQHSPSSAPRKMCGMAWHRRFSNFCPRSLRKQRIDKILVERGVRSRNEATKLLFEGKVEVNGKIIRGRGEKFYSSAVIRVASSALPCVPLLVAYHKPVGIITSIGDPYHRPNLLSIIEKFPILKDMHPVGRLDQDTSGILLFSRCGELTNFLLNPDSMIEREYEALVAGNVNFDDLMERLAYGVATQLGRFSAKLTKSSAATIPNHSLIRLIVTEGKYRMVRRILHNVGHSVHSLHRIRYGQMELLELQEGECRPIAQRELEWLISLFHKI